MNSFTKEFKIKVITEYNQAKNISPILEKYNIAKSILFDWISRYRMLTNKMKCTIGDYIHLKTSLIKKFENLKSRN